MKTFKKFAATLAIAAASLSIAGAAQAQPGYGPNGPNRGQHQAIQQGWNLSPARSAQIRQDIASLNTAIDRAAARRTISPREAAGLRQQARSVQRLYGQYARGGLDRSEVRTLQDRVNTVRVALRMERRDWDSRRG
jgi:Spy/CpxP family protein refolding chaperone